MSTYVIQVSDHFVRLSDETLSVEYVLESTRATRFADQLEASVKAHELRLPGYLVIPCPQ